MVQEKRTGRLRLLGLVGDGDDILRSIVDRHDILLGKLVGEVGLGNILYGIEDPTRQKVQILEATATADLTLTTSAASITGDGDSSKVRIIIPLPGDWLIEAAIDFDITATDPDACIGELYVDDSGSPETGRAVYWPTPDLNRATVPQRWKVTTTAINTPVELKAKKDGAGGTAIARGGANNTRLTAIGGGGAADIRLSNHGLLEGLSDISDHAYASLIDGTRAFTGVVAGIFPTEHAHLATKEYVDSAIHFIEDYFFNNTASSYSGIYFKMLDTPTGEAESTFQSGSLGEGDDQALFNFATDAGAPGVTTLEAGVYTGHIHARVTLSNKRPVKIHFKVYFRDNGSETLVATSEETDFLTNSATEYNIHAVLVADVTIATTDRLIIKWFANVDSTPSSNVIVELFAEGTNASRFQVPVTTDVLNQVFLRQDGTKVGSTSQAQDFGSNGIKADKLAESTGNSHIEVANALKLTENDTAVKTDAEYIRGQATTGSVALDLRSSLIINLDSNSNETGASVTIRRHASSTDMIRLTEEASIYLLEKAAADADVPAYGQIWVKTGTPNELWFTRDDGTEIRLDV